MSSEASLTSWGEVPLALVGHPCSDVTIKTSYGIDILLYQPALDPLPIGLVKTESDFIIRSVTGLGRQILVVAVISVNDYLFLAFSDLTLEVATKRFLQQEVKMLGYFQCHVCIWKCVPTAISSGVDICKVPGCHLLL